MSNTPLQGRNRTSIPGGTNIGGELFPVVPITGTGITPAQAAAAAAPIEALLSIIPYELDHTGRLDYRKAPRAMTHAPELTYANDPRVPPALRGQTIDQGLYEAAYIAQYGGAPMPYLDLDSIHPTALEHIIGILNSIRTAVATAT